METNEPTFFEQLQLLLVKLNEAFPARDGKAHNITLNETGHIHVTVWDKNKDGTPCSWFVTLDGEDDDLQSFDDLVEALSKYARENAK